MSSSGFETIDFIIFGVYIVVLVALGLFLGADSVKLYEGSKSV